MRSRLFRISFLLFLSLWYAVILPGHQRGVVQLPGAGTSSDSCCAMDQPGKSDQPKPCPVGSPRNCAVCYHMSTLELPPAINWGIAPLGLVSIRLESPSTNFAWVNSFDLYQGRAPPSA